MHSVLINNIPLSARLTYKNIPAKNLNAAFTIERMDKINQSIWHIPIKIGLSFYLICSINSDQTITFLDSSQILKNHNYLSKIFDAKLINNILGSTMKLRRFNQLLQRKINIPIYDISSRNQLKEFIESALIKKMREFFIQSDDDIETQIEAKLMQEDIYYVSPAEQKVVNSFYKELFHI